MLNNYSKLEFPITILYETWQLRSQFFEALKYSQYFWFQIGRFHAECLTCTRCRTKIDEGKFSFYENKLFCDTCDLAITRGTTSPQSSNSSSNSKLTAATVISRKSTIHVNHDSDATVDDLYSLPVSLKPFLMPKIEISRLFYMRFLWESLATWLRLFYAYKKAYFFLKANYSPSSNGKFRQVKILNNFHNG